MLVGLVWLIFLPVETSDARIMVGMITAGGLQATTRVFGQSFGTALAAIGFSLSASHGSTWGLCFAALCAALAIGVNMVRLKATQTARL